MAKKSKPKPKAKPRPKAKPKPKVAVAADATGFEESVLVITPVHPPGVQFLDDAYQSLCRQSVKWRWSILANNGAMVPEHIRGDSRVHVNMAEQLMDGEACKRIGALKLHACCSVPTELLVIPYMLELDCDDILNADALELVLRRFEDGADFVYSDCAEFYYDAHGRLASARPDKYPFGEAYGWSSYTPGRSGCPFSPEDAARLIAMRSPSATPQNLRLIEWTPNHLRAWTRDIYERVGGHDASMAAADDHNLVVRMYLAGAKFMHIPVCLYYQRVHTANSQTVFNGEVRAGTWNVYNQNIYELARKFSRDNNLAVVDLCSGPNVQAGIEGWDRLFGHDLDGRWPAADNSVGLIIANDAVEHLRDPIHTMNEAHRVLAPGGFFFVSVPSTDGRGAFCDPTHVSFWNPLSFRYYCEPQFHAFIPRFHGKFVCSKLIQWMPTQWHRDNNVPYVEAHLIKDYNERYGANMSSFGV